MDINVYRTVRYKKPIYEKFVYIYIQPFWVCAVHKGCLWLLCEVSLERVDLYL